MGLSCSKQRLSLRHMDSSCGGWSPKHAGLVTPWHRESQFPESERCSVVSDSLRPLGLYSPWNSPGHNTGVGYSLLQGIFPTQGSNPCLPHCRQILYQLSHKRSPRILEWVASSISSGSSRPGNQIGGSPALQVESLPTELSGKPFGFLGAL